MFEAIKSLFSGGKEPEAPPSDDAPADPELQRGVAGLLVEAARADGDYAPVEIARVDAALQALFDVTETAAADLRAQAEDAQARANDLYGFTREAKALAPADKIQFIERLWDVVLADGARDAYEDALVRRVCGLIHVDDQDSGAARRRVTERRSLGGPGAEANADAG
ncbi:MAG: TerB family tellurite resistance protein [Pseudomonadota bacterium]